jgi:putative phosphonate transport system ATP-binding protein
MDEPTSGLDVSVQAKLLDLLRTLTRGLSLAAIVVTHDLAVARLLAHRMMVMKEGRVVEAGETQALFAAPQAEYTRTLLAAVEPTPAR